MNSINQNQPEHNLENLSGTAAVQRIREMIERSPVGFFCTRPLNAGTHGVRPMTVQQVDDRGRLWFLSASDSEHNRDLQADPTVRLYFQGSTHSDFLHLDGAATVSTDRDRIESLWSPLFKTWFTGGIDDPLGQFRHGLRPDLLPGHRPRPRQEALWKQEAASRGVSLRKPPWTVSRPKSTKSLKMRKERH